MSWRKIEKVWDEVRSAQEPKRNLSKQPKKSREVALSEKDELYDIITLGFDSIPLIKDVEAAVQAIDAFMAAISKSKVSEYSPDIVPDFYSGQLDKAKGLHKNIMSKADDLGVDLYTILGDYTEYDYNDSMEQLSTLYKLSEDFQYSLDDLENLIKRFR
jgi:hypothetical protein